MYGNDLVELDDDELDRDLLLSTPFLIVKFEASKFKHLEGHIFFRLMDKDDILTIRLGQNCESRGWITSGCYQGFQNVSN